MTFVDLIKLLFFYKFFSPCCWILKCQVEQRRPLFKISMHKKNKTCFNFYCLVHSCKRSETFQKEYLKVFSKKINKSVYCVNIAHLEVLCNSLVVYNCIGYSTIIGPINDYRTFKQLYIEF